MEFLEEEGEVVVFDETLTGRVNTIQHRVTTRYTQPIRQPLRRLPASETGGRLVLHC